MQRLLLAKSVGYCPCKGSVSLVAYLRIIASRMKNSKTETMIADLVIPRNRSGNNHMLQNANAITSAFAVKLFHTD